MICPTVELARDSVLSELVLNEETILFEVFMNREPRRLRREERFCGTNSLFVFGGDSPSIGNLWFPASLLCLSFLLDRIGLTLPKEEFDGGRPLVSESA